MLAVWVTVDSVWLQIFEILFEVCQFNCWPFIQICIICRLKMSTLHSSPPNQTAHYSIRSSPLSSSSIAHSFPQLKIETRSICPECSNHIAELIRIHDLWQCQWNASAWWRLNSVAIISEILTQSLKQVAFQCHEIFFFFLNIQRLLCQCLLHSATKTKLRECRRAYENAVNEAKVMSSHLNPLFLILWIFYVNVFQSYFVLMYFNVELLNY